MQSSWPAPPARRSAPSTAHSPHTPAHELGIVVIKEVLARAGVDGKEVDEVILGQVLTAGQGQNPARQASIGAGLPKETTAWGLNQVCGSGLRAIALGMQQIRTGDASIIVAGGQESMSLAPHCQHLRQGIKMGDFKMIDTMIKDGLMDAFYGYHMGNHRRERRASVAVDPRRAGRVRARLAEQGRGRPEGRQVQGRDRRRDHQGQEGRHRRRPGRVYPPRRDARCDAEAEAGLRQGRHGDRRQRIRPQ